MGHFIRKILELLPMLEEFNGIIGVALLSLGLNLLQSLRDNKM